MPFFLFLCICLICVARISLIVFWVLDLGLDAVFSCNVCVLVCRCDVVVGKLGNLCFLIFK